MDYFDPDEHPLAGALADMEQRALTRLGASSRDFAVDLNGYNAIDLALDLERRRYIVSASVIEDRGVAAVLRVIFKDKGKSAPGGVSVHDVRRRIAEFIGLNFPETPDPDYVRAV